MEGRKGRGRGREMGREGRDRGGEGWIEIWRGGESGERVRGGELEKV